MSILSDALAATLGTIVQFDKRQYPSSVISCAVPRDKFGRAAKALKKAYALLAAEWVTDETPFGGGLALFACYRWGSEYLIVRSELPLDDPSFPALLKSTPHTDLSGRCRVLWGSYRRDIRTCGPG